MALEDDPPRGGHVIGRYALYDAIASGGMATVYYGRLLGPVGFARTVAIKRLHPHVASDPEFASMFLDEARLAARVHHPNVVQTLDVVALKRELILVMEYVRGESLARLMTMARQRGEPMPLPVLSAIMAGALHGLHAAHEAKSERGEPLDLVHRDVSPQNILVGVDGVARVLDFGVAKAVGRLQTTRDGQIKGKLAYMAPEQLRAGKVTRRTDVYAAGVVLWEGLAGRRLFQGDNEGAVLEQVLLGYIDPPSKFAPALPEPLDALALRALDRDPDARFATAREMAEALERAAPPALAAEVGAWVVATAGDKLAEIAVRVAEIESDSGATRPARPSWIPEGTEDVARAAGGSDAGTERRVPPFLEPDAGAMPSQISSISVSRASAIATDRQRSRRTLVWAGGLAGGVAVLGALIAAFAAGSRSAAPRNEISIAPAESAALPSSEATTPPAPAPVSDAVADAAILAPPSARAMVAPTRPKAAPIASPPKDDCRIKFTVDANGRKLYKRNCL